MRFLPTSVRAVVALFLPACAAGYTAKRSKTPAVPLAEAVTMVTRGNRTASGIRCRIANTPNAPTTGDSKSPTATH